MQRIMSVDSQILNSIQSCARKTKLAFIDCYQTPEKAEPLEKGDLMHKMLEVYYSLKLDKPDFTTETWKELLNAGLEPTMPDIAVRAGRFFSTQMSVDFDVVDEVIYQFTAYKQYYENDEWHPLAVEQVGSKVLYEDEDLKIVYNFKVDLLAEKGKIVAPFDHKTGSRRHNPTSLSNQFIGYCYGLSLENILINKIGFQKTLKPNERFQRFLLIIDKDRTSEWVQNSIHWLKYLDHCNQTGEYPMNLTSCDKYSGCVFAPICESDPGSREWKLERDFKHSEEWDVAKELT